MLRGSVPVCACLSCVFMYLCIHWRNHSLCRIKRERGWPRVSHRAQLLLASAEVKVDDQDGAYIARLASVNYTDSLFREGVTVGLLSRR